MNDRYEREVPGLNQFFAEAEMDSEVRGRGRRASRRTGAARPIGIRRQYAFGMTRPVLISPWPPFKFRPVKPIKFPILLPPRPGLLDPSLWPVRPPYEPPRPPSGSPSPPSSGSPTPASEPEPAYEPPDTTSGEPPSDEPAPSGDADDAANAAAPSEELLSLFSEYEYPTHEVGGHEAGCCGGHGQCTCGQGRPTVSQPSSSALLSEFFEQFEDPQATVLGLEALDTEFEAARYSEPEWENEQSTSACSAFTPTAVENPGGGRIKDKRIPPRSELVTITGAFGAKVPIHRVTAAAHTALVCAARADGIRSPILLPTGTRSGFRDPKQQMEAWKRAVARYQSEKEANKWVARPGSSAHQTGRAIDFYLGLSNSSSNVARLRNTRAYAWMQANAHRFGFYPYPREPWHWEYNPPASAASKGELNEFFTPFAHSGGFPGRYRSGQRIGFRQRHPRSRSTSTGEYEFSNGNATTKPASATISSLATTKFGLRKGSKRSVPVFGVCVHTTGSGPASKAKKDPRRSALQRALDFYIKGSEGFPHYVIAYDGSIVATCDERQIAWHAGFGKKERAHYKTWTAPRWWSSVWNPKGASSPLDLFPKGAVSANSAHIGIEMLADTTGYGFTNAQYESLARLTKDISRRHQLSITSAPSARLLGHEDVHPLGRQNKGGGWDPGAHRDKPKFSWSRLWSLITASP